MQAGFPIQSDIAVISLFLLPIKANHRPGTKALRKSRFHKEKVVLIGHLAKSTYHDELLIDCLLIDRQADGPEEFASPGIGFRLSWRNNRIVIRMGFN